jgi:phosphonate transport system substrate-binding protein
LFLLAFVSVDLPAKAERTGTAASPLRVLLIPADGGTEDGTRADFLPLFNAITRTSGIHFDVRTGQSYAAVIEGMCAGQAEIAWLGPVSYVEAHKRGCADLLAIEERDGSSTYYAGIFVSSASGVDEPRDLHGKSIALGSQHSASSFSYPLSMLSKAGVDPFERPFDAVRITGSHANSLQALQNGLVHAAGASFVSFERAVNQGGLRRQDFRLLIKSDPIPNPRRLRCIRELAPSGEGISPVLSWQVCMRCLEFVRSPSVATAANRWTATM